MAAAAPFAGLEKTPNQDNMEVKKELHTKYATPYKLSKELVNLLGTDAKFKVEVRTIFQAINIHVFTLYQMRHNVYNIESSKEFDVVSGKW
jgi:hypothetical protein